QQQAIDPSKRHKWYVLIGCDTYINVPHLLKQLEPYNFTQPYFIGGSVGEQMCYHKKGTAYKSLFIGGNTAHVFSAALVQALYPHLSVYVESIWPQPNHTSAALSDVALSCLIFSLGFKMTILPGFFRRSPNGIIKEFGRKEALKVQEPSSWHYIHPAQMIDLDEFYVYHPINDIKHQLSSFNVQFIDKSLSGHCHLTKTCAKDLKILNSKNGMNPSLEDQKRFYEVYKNDFEMNHVNAFICFHPASMCEVFMPFNRTLIVIASTRYELGRFSKEEWRNWNKNLQIIASNSRNVIAGNNLYDAEYIRYFTGVKAIVLPSLCAYTNASYKQVIGKPFIIASIHEKNFHSKFMSMLTDSFKHLKIAVAVAHLRDVYKSHYKYSQLAEHPGIIYVPYQVSVMSLFEQYRMNIPLFFPSLDLLTEWHHTYGVVNERTWDSVSGKKKNASIVSGVLDPNIPDPNNEFDLHAIRYWLKFSDFYQWPHIIYFNSTDELVIKLTTTNLTQVSLNMKVYNANLKQYLFEQWRQILQRIE
ncbi:unnamed protein product, partial [Rotaria sordida]